MNTRLFETILRYCAEAAPQPWYPSAFPITDTADRAALDHALDELRLAGLVRLTDWVAGSGQGYALTPEGTRALNQPGELARLAEGTSRPLPARAEGRDGEPRRIGTWERGEAARAALTRPVTPAVTFLLIFTNVLWFCTGMALAQRDQVPLNDYLWGGQGNGRILRELGAVNGPDVYFDHQWWRLLTCCFVHIGVVHLGVNMYSLYVVGPLLEQIWGSWRFLALYLISGFGGSCFMLIGNPVGGGAGASGALWGIMASLGAWLFLNRHVLPPPLVAMWRRQLITVLILNLFITFGIPSVSDHISKGAHLGGGLVGLLAAVPLDYLRFGKPGQRWIAVAGLISIPALSFVAMLWSFRASEDTLRKAMVGEEMRTFLPEFAVPLQRAVIGADEVFLRSAVPLLRETPARRNAEAVQDAVVLLGQRRQALDDIAAELDHARPFQNPNVESLRRLSAEEAQNMARVLELAERRLQAGQTWSEEDRAQRLEVIRNWNRWLNQVQGAPKE